MTNDVHRRGRRRCDTFVTKSGSHISQERFHLKSLYCANLHTGRVYNHTGYNVTIYFRSKVIDVRKMAENAHRRLRLCMSRELFELESLNFIVTSTPNYPPCALDIISLTTSGRNLSPKTVENEASDVFRWNFSRKV